MKHATPATLLALMTLSGACASVAPAPAESDRLERAVAIALESSAAARAAGQGEYRITSAQERILDGRYIWIISFKPLALLPADPSLDPMGLGGEVLVNVDLSDGSSSIRFGQ